MIIGLAVVALSATPVLLAIAPRPGDLPSVFTLDVYLGHQVGLIGVAISILVAGLGEFVDIIAHENAKSTVRLGALANSAVAIMLGYLLVGWYAFAVAAEVPPNRRDTEVILWIIAAAVGVYLIFRGLMVKLAK